MNTLNSTSKSRYSVVKNIVFGATMGAAFIAVVAVAIPEDLSVVSPAIGQKLLASVAQTPGIPTNKAVGTPGNATEVTPPVPVTDRTMQISSEPMQTFPIMVGDKIKVSFLEKVTLSSLEGDDKTAVEPQLRSFFERPDLSGEFEVSEGGQISHPILGLFKVSGTALFNLENQLAQEGLKVRTSFVSRPPVYVTGFVTNPGAYKYISGMTVSHAVTLASGRFRNPAQQNALNAADQFKQFEQKLALSTARRARLQAALAGEARLVMPSELLELVGPQKAQTIFEKEQGIFKRLHSMQGNRQLMLERAARLARQNIDTYQGQQRIVAKQDEIILARLNKFNRVYGSAYLDASPRSREKLARIELQRLELANRKIALDQSLTSARQKLNQIEREIVDLELTETTKLKNELDSVERDMIDHAANLAMAQNTISTVKLRQPSRTKSLSGMKTKYEIRRVTDGRIVQIAANDTSTIGPGDIVTVMP